MYAEVFPYVLGVALAGVTIYPTSFLGPNRERLFLTVVIGVVIVSFFPFPLSRGDSVGLAWELGAMVVLGALLALSLKYPVLLPLVWFGHGSWDLLFLVGTAPVDKPAWVVQLCVPYDWLIAAYIVSRLGRWRAAAAVAS